MDDTVSVFIHKDEGERIAGLVDSGISVNMNINVGQVYKLHAQKQTSQSSQPKAPPLLIISATLISLLIMGLAALLVYGIRRSKQQQQKSRRRRVVSYHVHFTKKIIIQIEMCWYSIELMWELSIHWV